MMRAHLPKINAGFSCVEFIRAEFCLTGVLEKNFIGKRRDTQSQKRRVAFHRTKSEKA